jgi:multicomponent Na+:H+ antiporter subunit F
VSVYLIGGAVILIGIAPLMVFAVRASPEEGLIALDLGGTIATLVLLLIAAGTGRQPFFDLAIVSAILSYAAGLLYARLLERWL